jgi:glycosyltransferase involved in cell wall biosynthesis
MPADLQATRAGIVVIGRNEGERLSACLRSLRAAALPIVYVDSGSSDRSVELARSQANGVVELDPARPFSAARARNEGFAALVELDPTVEYVQFIDGDCTLAPGWIDAASAALDADPRKAIVIGHLEERHPRDSVYNRLCSLEWRSQPGDVTSFGALGGIMFVRAVVFASLKGFNVDVIAGEDSEFGVRVGAAGHKVTKLDAPMATHDADIRRFGQWWRRAVRAGHAIGQRSFLNGRSAGTRLHARTAQHGCVGLAVAGRGAAAGGADPGARAAAARSSATARSRCACSATGEGRATAPPTHGCTPASMSWARSPRASAW